MELDSPTLIKLADPIRVDPLAERLEPSTRERPWAMEFVERVTGFDDTKNGVKDERSMFEILN